MQDQLKRRHYALAALGRRSEVRNAGKADEGRVPDEPQHAYCGSRKEAYNDGELGCVKNMPNAAPTYKRDFFATGIVVDV